MIRLQQTSSRGPHTQFHLLNGDIFGREMQLGKDGNGELQDRSSFQNQSGSVYLYCELPLLRSEVYEAQPRARLRMILIVQDYPIHNSDFGVGPEGAGILHVNLGRLRSWFQVGRDRDNSTNV